MRWLLNMLAALLVTSATYAADEPLHGVALGDIDRSADPCNDFFQYANGQWRAENPVPASMPRWSRRWAAGEAAKDRLKTLLDAAASAQSPRGSVQQLTGDFYAGCMDEAQANRAGLQPLAPLLQQIDAVKSSRDVQSVIAQLQAVSVQAPFLFMAGSDNHEPSQVIAQIYASGLGLPDRDYYLKDEERFSQAREKYLEYVRQVFALSGADDASARRAAATVMEFEKRLATASLDRVSLRNPRATDHKMTFAELQRLTPGFDWRQFYRALGVSEGYANVAEPRFLQEVNRQLAETSLDQWRVYLKWQLLDSMSPSLSDDFAMAHYGFHQAYLNGAKEMKPRWKRCVESTDELLGEALGKLYVDKYFPPEAKARMQELVKNLLLAMRETIDELDWMSAPTKQKAYEKLATFDPKIGYPDKWKDYSSIPVKRDAYFASLLAARRFNVNEDLATINKPVDRSRWYITAPTSDAYYNPLLNEIVFPAGILQPPAFDLHAIDAVNYGAIGVVIGHEISHGFDDQGAQFDAQGRLKNWWTDDDLKKFQDRGACVVKQFDGYSVEPGLYHKGKLVLGESIGDLAGAKLAYRALKISQRGKPAPAKVDGLTDDQQFFLAWGQFRGDEIRPEFARKMAQGDPHPIAKYRVIGPLSNLPQFQQAFQCKAGSPMVRAPEERCEVW